MAISLPKPNPTTRDPCADAATPPHYPPASQDIAILRRRKHNTLQAFTRKMHSASILIRSPSRRSRTTRRLYSLFPPKHDRLSVPTRLRAAATIKEGLLDLVLDAKKLRHFLACLQLTRIHLKAYVLRLQHRNAEAQWPLDDLDILLWLNTILKEVLASSVDAFAAFASMDIIFAHHNGTLPVTYTAQGPPSRRTSTSRSRPFARCATSGPILPSPVGQRSLASALQAARNGGVVQNSDACMNASVRRRGTLARGQSSGQLRLAGMRRAAGRRNGTLEYAIESPMAASCWPCFKRPKARCSNSRARTYSASVESAVFRFRFGLNAITWLT
ncbi:hypothetical protein C8J57DRAFT_1237923 [Mycena rebaudengoi]|nr:hypothetical protein C8J57DRAFT_1237923 [Mycena rebaudengoi]